MRLFLTFMLITGFFLFSGSECTTDLPEGTCLDNALAVGAALHDTYPLIFVEGDYAPDTRHVDCFYWEDGRWRRGYWTGLKVVEVQQDWLFCAQIYSYKEYIERVKRLGWR